MLSVIIPAYNEENRIINTINKIEEVLLREKVLYEIVVVNDGSTDKTAEVLKKVKRENFTIVSYEINKGKGGAVACGVSKAKGDVIVFTDADLPYPPENIIRAKNLIQAGCDVVLGKRLQKENGQKYPWYRRILSFGFGCLVDFFLHLNEKDTQCGFKAFTKQAAQEIFKRVSLNGWGFDVEIIFIAKKHHFNIKRLPVELYHTNEGSKIHLVKDPLRMAKEVLAVKRNDKKGLYE